MTNSLFQSTCFKINIWRFRVSCLSLSSQNEKSTMYHICKSKSKTQPFIVVNVAENGKVINTSETLTSKQAAFKNIGSNLSSILFEIGGENTFSIYFITQDDTLKKPKVFKVVELGKKYPFDMPAHPKYIPGKNKKSL
jgi:uncharacterized protein YegP (UPF0339 family)